MRPVFYSDVVAAARVVLAVPIARQSETCARLLKEAHWADMFTRRLGRPHPIWGGGTLLEAASRHKKAVEPTFDDVAYCEAFGLVLAQLAARKGEQDL